MCCRRMQRCSRCSSEMGSAPAERRTRRWFRWSLGLALRARQRRTISRFPYEILAFQSGLIIVGALLRAARQLNLLLSHLLVWKGFQDVRDAIEAPPSLVISANDEPWRMLGIGHLQH